MSVREFYENIKGSYEDIFAVFPDEELILYFVRCFKSDESYYMLLEAAAKKDIFASFEAAHRLKGLASSLAFSELYSVVCELSNQLYSRTEPAREALLNNVTTVYNRIIREIECL